MSCITIFVSVVLCFKYKNQTKRNIVCSYHIVTCWQCDVILSDCSGASWISPSEYHGLLARYVKLGLCMCRERFPRHRELAIPTCITHVPWCMSGSLTSGFLWSRWRGRRSRHSRQMCNPQFYVSGKRPIREYRFTPTQFPLRGP